MVLVEIDRSQLSLVFQPQINGRDGRILGTEALVRWSHPTLGPIGPDEFVPLAERIGMIEEIDRWVLNQACEQVERWRKAGVRCGPVSVNFSAKEIQNPDLFERIADVLERTGLSGSDLILEVTETALVAGSEAMGQILSRIRETGVRVAIDDFGSGFSNLSLLSRLPIDLLKIDRSLVEAAAGDEKGERVLQATLLLAASIEIDVIAEGIETEDQRQLLLEMGCEVMQGYLFAHPLPAEEISATLRRAVVAIGEK